LTVNIKFSKTDLVKLDQILAQMIHYADGSIDAVGGLEEEDLPAIREYAYNFRTKCIDKWLNDYDTYDGSSQDASFT